MFIEEYGLWVHFENGKEIHYEDLNSEVFTNNIGPYRRRGAYLYRRSKFMGEFFTYAYLKYHLKNAYIERLQ